MFETGETVCLKTGESGRVMKDLGDTVAVIVGKEMKVVSASSVITSPEIAIKPLITPQLRDYQQDLINRVYSQWECHQKVLAQLPTGGGKSVIFGAITSEFASRGLRILVIAHRVELIVQGAEHLKRWTDVPVGIIKAGYKFDINAPIQFASVQSLGSRLNRVGEYDLIIIDEAHHATAESYRRVLDRFPSAQVLGLTATPCRTNGKGFDDIFEVLECGITTDDLIEQGHLSPYKIFAGEKKMKTDGVRTKDGDYNIKDLAAANNITEIAGNLVENYQKHVGGGSCMVFAINVAHSEAIAKAYRAAGIFAEHLDGETDKHYRKHCLDLFRKGELKVISNVGLFGEGVDVPQLNAIQVARPTKSLALYLQMAGRVLRRSEGKEYGIILDHTDNLKIHGFPDDPRAWSLFPKPKKESKILPAQETAPEKEASHIVETSEELQEQIRNQAIADAWKIREEKLAKIPDELWRHNLRSMLQTQIERGYKPGWMLYRLVDMNAPYHVWQILESILNYKPGWANYKWKEMQQKQQAA